MTVYRSPVVLPGQPLLELQQVSRRFVKKLDRNRSLQDLFIRLVRPRRTQREAQLRDAFWPLRDVSLTVNAGDCIGIIGPNGSGKSTLLKLITGILPPTSGDLYVRGRVSSLLELGAGFHPDLTGRENVFLNGSIYGVGCAEIAARLDQIIDYAGIGDFIDTPVKHYSSGMYVRLGFAVAIHTHPDLLLVDEVLAVGDANFQNKCMESIFTFRRRGGTLLLVSHDLHTIQTLCTRALWINDGRIGADGDPTDVVMAYKMHLAEEEEQARRAAGPVTINDDQRWGTQTIRITGVELFDAAGQPRYSFATGQPMTIKLSYDAPQPVERPTFGIGINHQNGAHVFGPNTDFGGFETGHVAGQGVITYTIPELPLLEGQYVVSVAVTNHEDTLTYDYHDRAYTFQVAYSPGRTGYGMVQLQGIWGQERAQAVPPSPVAPDLSLAGQR